MNRPHDWDVLAGRGGHTNAHPGNKLFRQFVTSPEFIEMYRRANDKNAVGTWLVTVIRGFGCDFLVENQGVYLRQSDEAARDKVVKLLREAVRTAPMQEPPVAAVEEPQEDDSINDDELSILMDFLDDDGDSVSINSSSENPDFQDDDASSLSTQSILQHDDDGSVMDLDFDLDSLPEFVGDPDSIMEDEVVFDNFTFVGDLALELNEFDLEG